MKKRFDTKYVITPLVARNLMRIEAVKENIAHVPFNPSVLISLRESARLYSTHYSTMIEGNRLSSDQIEEVIKHKGHFPGRERDEKEVKGYYSALQYVEQLAAKGTPLTEKIIQKLHEMVMLGQTKGMNQDLYRDGQNVIRDGRTGVIIYLPPEAKDVPELMKELVAWINQNKEVPSPIIAGIAHYQFATIHPYYDGNGRTARLLTNLILYLSGYDLKGLYSLEEYYARNLSAYYEAISVGPSHNYYEGRPQSDITKWVDYFIGGMAVSFENVIKHMSRSALRGDQDHEDLLRTLDPKKRKALELFQAFATVTSAQIGELFGFKPRTSTQLCKDWVEEGFLVIIDPSNKNRSYGLAPTFEVLITSQKV
ncbi:MAG TPA: Fic family protein [Candidatus Babeliales bacterium]|jgi:Fic family protein|nr:Fic family protein [Candidatus Babeliales bacterium]